MAPTALQLVTEVLLCLVEIKIGMLNVCGPAKMKLGTTSVILQLSSG